MTRDEIAEDFGEELLFLDEPYFDEAIVGVVHRFSETVVCYDLNKIIELLMTVDEMSEEDAIEHFHYNIVGAWVGEKTPAFLEVL
jgi:hypothetical protein